MNKSRSFAGSFRSIVTVVAAFSFAFVLAGGAYAASTIGTNLSTTGTFTVTPASDSVTSIRFQNAAGTNYFVADSTNFRIGVGAAPSTTFEVQGTASASYLFTANSLQVLGTSGASKAYSRFGVGSTGHSLAAADDVLFSGLVEFDDNAFFDANLTTALTSRVGIGAATNTTLEVQGTASASYFITANSLQVFGPSSVSYSRFGTGTTGHSLAAADDVLFTGLVEFDDNAFFDAKASVSGNFQISGRFIADTAASHSFTGDLVVSSNLIVGSTTASSSGGAYVAEFVSSATPSINFTSTGNVGSCLQLTNTAGSPVYARVFGTTWTVNATPCR